MWWNSPQARRPRPTFDDGALTRTFKFPSKSYPRSSYYVTSTEIIIRIKKARKKWKLTILKKRVVSYRTNRWFAKPRWIALEVTYTQAVKLGLVEARVRAPEAIPAEPAAVTPVPSVPYAAEQELIAPADVIAAHAEAEVPYALADQPEDPGEAEGDEHFELAPDQDDDTDEEAIEDEEEKEGEAASPPPSPPSPSSQPSFALVPDVAPPPPSVTVAIARPEPIAAPVTALPSTRLHTEQTLPLRPRRPFRRAVTALAAALTGLTVWAASGTPPQLPKPGCAPDAPGLQCTSPIVTGSVDVRAAPQPALSDAAEDLPPSPTQTTDIARADAVEQSLAASMPAPPPLIAADEESESVAALTPPPVDKSQEASTVVLLLERDLALPLAPPAFATPVAASAPEAPARADCRGLEAAARKILITFDYARSRFDPAMAALLDDFAARMRDCPGNMVTIEGHTDSDGGLAQNRSLSLRRAQAVERHLVNAGVDPRRLTAVGFGPSRPAAPNVSAKNKRHTRRAALVVVPQH